MMPTGLQESLLTIKRKHKCALPDSSRAQKYCFWCWAAAPDVEGGRSCSSELGRECVDAWWWWWGRYGWGVSASHWCALSYVGINHDSEMTFSHPSNKLHIQQISGSLPNHFFPLQSLRKLHVGLDYRDIIQKIFYLRHHLVLGRNLRLPKLLDNNFLLCVAQRMNSLYHILFFNPPNCLV